VAVSIPTDAFGRFERLSFVPRRTARAGIGGEHRSRRSSPSTDYVDFRAYQPGDDFRRVDWNVYARLGTLQVKLTEGRERLSVLLVLDGSSSMDYGTPPKLTVGAQLVAALAYIGTARADSVRIACLGSQERAFGPFARRGRMPDVVRQLSQIAPAGLVNLNAGLGACLPDDVDFRGSAPPLVVVVSDLLTPNGVGAGLDALLAQGADVVVAHVVSDEEANPTVTGEVELLDAESGAKLEVGVSLTTLAAYRERFATWLDSREADCHARGMRYVRVPTERPLASLVLDDMRRAGILR
jgi:uncharacterized protein (DUF58 family)